MRVILGSLIGRVVLTRATTDKLFRSLPKRHMLTTLHKAWAVTTTAEWTALDLRKTLTMLVEAHVVNSWKDFIETLNGQC